MARRAGSNITGTKEWSERSVNCCLGCRHNCRYCYAASMAARFKRTTLKRWRDEAIKTVEVNRARRYHPGVTMFPTTHDITPHNYEACETVLLKLLGCGNRVLIVSKPHLECIRRLCKVLRPFEELVMFRFTIGMVSESLREFWEPGAPSVKERLACLRHVSRRDYATSVSCEPLLEPWKVKELVRRVRPYVEHSIWIGMANQLRRRTKGRVPRGHPKLLRLEQWQTQEKVRQIYEALKGDPLVKFKDSYKKALGLARPKQAGLDI